MATESQPNKPDQGVSPISSSELNELSEIAALALVARCLRRLQPLATWEVDERGLKAPAHLLDQYISSIEEGAAVEGFFVADVGDDVRQAFAHYPTFAANAEALIYSVQACLDADYQRGITVLTNPKGFGGDVDVGLDVLKQARIDFDRLKLMPHSVEQINPTADGPCGPLWEDDEAPDWFVEAFADSRRRFQVPKQRTYETPHIDFVEIAGQLSTKLQSTQTEIEKLSKESGRLEERLQLAQKEKSELEKAVNEAKAELELADKTLGDYDQQITELQRAKSVDKNQIQELHRSIDKASENSHRLQEKIDGMEEDLSSVREELVSTLERLRESHNKLAQEQKKNRDAEFRIQELLLGIEQKEDEIEFLKPQGVKWYLKRLSAPHSIFQMIAVVVLCAMVAGTLAGISEVHGRQTFASWLNKEIESVRTLEVEALRSGEDDSPAQANRESLEQILYRLEMLSFTGAATENETMSGQARKLQALSSVGESASLQVPPPLDGERGTFWLNPIRYWSSDLLLSLVVMISGTIGAVISRLRSFNPMKTYDYQPLSFRDIGLGMAAGFVTFLVIRGGKSMLLIDADPLLVINPYNSAFFGLLAGLFTDMAYALLRDFAERFVQKLRDAFISNNNGDLQSAEESQTPVSEETNETSETTSEAVDLPTD